jgi:tryptophan-rich sensory protein
MKGWNLTLTSESFLCGFIGDVIAYETVRYSPLVLYLHPDSNQAAAFSSLLLLAVTGGLTVVTVKKCSKPARLYFLYGIGVPYLAWKLYRFVQREINAYHEFEELNAPQNEPDEEFEELLGP